MKKMSCEITIGNYQFGYCHSFNIKSARRSIADTALIKLPNIKGANSLDKIIKDRDKVTIRAGYDGDLKTEFVGYVTERVTKVPFEIKCEDTMWLLKQDSINKTFDNVSLRSVVEYMANTDAANKVDISLDIPELTIHGLRIKNASRAKALEYIKDKFLMDVYFRTDPDTSKVYLFVGLPYVDRNLGRVIYDFQKNVPLIQPKLTYKTEDEVKVVLEGVSIRPDGEDYHYTSKLFDYGDHITRPYYNLTREQLKEVVERDVKLFVYTGYRGEMVTFGQPYARHGMIADVKDARYSERAGAFFIDGVELDYSPNGFRRMVTLGREANKLIS